MIFDLQKASMWKRISAFLVDFILLVIAIAGFAFLFSTVLGFDKYNTTLNDAYAKYEAEYGVVFDISQEEFIQLSEAEQQAWNNAYQALIKDNEAMYSYNMVINLTLLISTLAVLFAHLALEFFIPIILYQIFISDIKCPFPSRMIFTKHCKIKGFKHSFL